MRSQKTGNDCRAWELDFLSVKQEVDKLKHMFFLEIQGMWFFNDIKVLAGLLKSVPRFGEARP